MRITICCKQFGRSGGAETFLRNFASCLLEDGHEVRVVAAQGEAEMPGVRFDTLSVPRRPRSLRDLALARAAQKALAAETWADVTFSDQKCLGADVVRPGGGVQRAYLPQRERSYPTPLRRLANRLWRRLSIRDTLRVRIDDELYAPPGPLRIVANSDMVRRNLVRFYPHLEDRIRVVYNGADPRRFHPGLRAEHRQRVRTELDIPDDALVGAFVAHDWRRKGLFPFIEALGILARKGSARPVMGIVVGRGNTRHAMAFARRCEALDRLRFVGSAAPDAYYGASDLLVLPTYFDPCANVTIEGMACGLPAITSIFNGAHGLITPQRTGFYMSDAADAAQLAGFLEYYLGRERLSEAGQAAAAKAADHTMHDMFRDIMGVVLEAAEMKASSAGNG